MNDNICPNCGEEIIEYDCLSCGYCSLDLDAGTYETPEGNIVNCTEEEALEKGYIFECPSCGNIITYWEKEDHGKCIECWHDDREVTT